MELQTKQPPELEFSMPEVEESLTAYLSAIGGAVIGLLLTLLILAIWNGGTLNFTNISKVNALEAGLTDVAADLDVVNTGVDTLGQRLALLEQESGAVAALQESLATLDNSLIDLDNSLAEQGVQIGELDVALSDLQVTRRNFDRFTAALAGALAQMESSSLAAAQVGNLSEARQTTPGSTSATQSSATQFSTQGGQTASPTAGSKTADDARQGSSPTGNDLPVSPATLETHSPLLAEPSVVLSLDVAPDSLVVFLYVDENADGVIDSDENLIAGASVKLISAGGEEMLSTGTVDTAGMLFSELNDGEYAVVVEDVQGFALASANSVTVNVDSQADAGQVVYFAVVTTLAD